ncbi:hypothetical protein KJA14_02120 [Patescibacteria group bacterium]|nr:hypothetical protein [Patescibacteria group bacterium]
MEITEAKRREVVRKLKMVEKSLPKIIELAEKGDFTDVPHEEMIVIETSGEGIFSTSVKESTVIFQLCLSDLLEKETTL